MKKTSRSSRQSGMSAILFASVFLIILSLISVGFVTLVRNDQKEVIDKALSYQAQYAAETAINRKAEELRNSPGSPANTSCSESLSINNGTNPAAAEVTCITWETSLPTITRSSLGTKPFYVPLRASGTPIRYITISWSPEDRTTPPYGSPSTDSLVSIDADNVPVLRVTLWDNQGAGTLKTFYLVASDGAAANVNFDTSESGSIALASCVLGSDRVCTARIDDTDITGNPGRHKMSLLAYGGQAKSVVISGFNGAGNPASFRDAQAEIDANAVANNVTKRIRARVSLTEQTWRPGFELASNELCKDYITDGSQTSPAGSSVCPLDGLAGGVALGGSGVSVGGAPAPGPGWMPGPGTIPQYVMITSITTLYGVTPASCTYTLHYSPTNPGGNYNALSPPIASHTDAGGLCAVGNTHTFNFYPPPQPCDAAPADCGKDGWYSVRLCINGTLCNWRSIKYRPYIW